MFEGYEREPGYCEDQAGKWQPRDPSKPFARGGKRVLYFLIMGGRLLKQRKVLPGRKVRIEDSDPRRHYWVLVAPRAYALPEGGSFRPRPAQRRVSKELVDRLWRAKLITGVAGDELDGSNVTDQGRDYVERTDWNGNWLEGRKP